MNPALLFLVRRSFVNAMRSRLARLRQIRYLVPFLLGVVYFGWFFGPWGYDRPAAATGARDRVSDLMIEWGMAAGLLLLATGSWLLPSRGPPVAFLEAEVVFLFPAPLRRKDLIRYKVLDVQKYIVPSVLLFSLLLGLRHGPAAVLRILVGGILVFNLLTLHQMGARLTRASLDEHGAAGWKRQALVLAVLAALGAVVAFGAPAFPSLRGLDAGAARDALRDWVERFRVSPAAWALLPFRLPGMLFASHDVPTFLLRAAPVAGLAAALYLWVVRCDAAFEEAAADHAQVLARRIEAARKGRLGFSGEERKTAKGSLFRLAPVGPPEPAFVWKGVTELLRHVPVRLVLVLVVAVFVGLPIALGESRGFGRTEGGRDLATTLALVVSAGMLMVCAMAVISGPTAIGSTLRTDLELVETLKTLPVTGPRLVRSYLAATVIPLGVAQALLAAAAAVLFPDPRGAAISPGWRFSGAACLVLLLPALTAVSALVDAAVALLFPAWFRPGQAQVQGGMEGMGIGLLYMIAKVLALGLGGGIPVAVGAGVVFAAGLLGVPTLLPGAAIAGALLAAALVALEVNLACGALGRRFEDMDPAKEGMLP